MSYGQVNTAALTVVEKLIANEQDASRHKPPFSYLSIEKSDRTNGHLWMERVVEVSQGRLRYLLAEDGKPLSEERHNREVSRLRAIAENPSSFIRHELARKDDEQRAQRMLQL